MIVEFRFNEKEAEILERIARLEHTDAATYFSNAFKWQLESDVNLKHFREEFLKLKEEFPDNSQEFEKKLEILKGKYALLE